MHLILIQFHHKQIVKCNTEKSLEMNKTHAGIIGDLTLGGGKSLCMASSIFDGWIHFLVDYKYKINITSFQKHPPRSFFR